MKDITLEQLLSAGCHFGHKTSKWNPKANDYIYKAIQGVHIIDLLKTKEGMEIASVVVKQYAAEGKGVLFVGTKRQATSLIRREAERVGAPYFNQRWIGGFITNWDEVKKNIQKLGDYKKLRKEKEQDPLYTKRELLLLDKQIHDLENLFGGVKDLVKPPDLMVLVDIKKESTAVSEAVKKGIPLVAITDTNVDPSMIAYPIPANDDAVGSVSCIITYLCDAYLEGKQVLEKNQNKEKKKVTKEKN